MKFFCNYKDMIIEMQYLMANYLVGTRGICPSIAITIAERDEANMKILSNDY